MEEVRQEYLWLISGIDIPMLMTMLWLAVKYYKETEQRLNELEKIYETLKGQFEQKLLDYKLHVANEYARITTLKEMERRVVSHLLRIENKLDVTALKTEAVHSRHRKDTNHESRS